MKKYQNISQICGCGNFGRLKALEWAWKIFFLQFDKKLKRLIILRKLIQQFFQKCGRASFGRL